MKYQQDLEQSNDFMDFKDSRIINALVSIYMCSVLLLTAHAPLNLVSEFIFVLAFGGCAFYMMMHSKNFRIDGFLMIFACFIGYCFISLLWSIDRNNSLDKIITLIQLYALAIILFSYISAYDNIHKFIRGLMIAGIVGSLVVIGYYGISDYIDLMLKGYRLGSPITNVNTIGLYTSTTVIICFYYAYIQGRKYAYALLLLPLLVTFGTGSRTAIAMSVIGILLLIFMRYRENISAANFLRFLGTIVVLIIFIYGMSKMKIFEGVFARLEDALSTTDRDSSSMIREKMVEFGVETFKKNPFFGVGIGNSGVILSERLGRNTYFHNDFIEILATTGLFGFVFYYGMYIYLLKNLYTLSVKYGDEIAALMMVLILSHMITGIGTVSYYDKMAYVYFAMAGATISNGKHRIEMEIEHEYEHEAESLYSKTVSDKNILYKER